MKYLLLLILLISCGKHEMPKKQELTDRDGDQIPDEYERSGFDKYVANITSLGKISAELTFKDGKEAIEYQAIDLENMHDLEAVAKNKLVKNIHTLSNDDYFSEDTGLRITSEKYPISIYKEKTSLRLRLKNFDDQVILSVFDLGTYTKIGNINKVLEFELSKDVMERILTGKSFISVSKEEKKGFYLNTQADDIRNKTYRVFFHDGSSTNIFYVSKEMSFSRFLKHMKINEYSMIDEVSLLSTVVESQADQWWVRNIGNDRVVVKDGLKNLSSHFVKGLAKEEIQLKRINGVTNNLLSFDKSISARAILKLRAYRTVNMFKKKAKDKTYVAHTLKCKSKDYYRQISGTVATDYTLGELANDTKFILDGSEVIKMEFKKGLDEKGAFWEFALPEGIKNFTVELLQLPQSEYIQIGLYKSSCEKFLTGPKLSKEFRTSEAELSLDIETYVEKL